MLKVTKEQISHWVKNNKRKAEAIFPELVMRAIKEFCQEELIKINIPYGDAVVNPGWDGFLEMSTDNEFFSIGKSLIEIGTSQSALQKANMDIDKRFKEMGVDVVKYHFVFFTPFQWKHRISISEWEESKVREQKWKSVTIIDGERLEEILSKSKETTLWFMNNHFDIKLSGVMTLVQYETYLNDNCNYNLSLDFFDYQDNVFERKTLDFLSGEESLLRVKGNNKEEVINFVSFILKKHGFDNVLIVTSSSAWNELLKIKVSNLILIPFFNLQHFQNIVNNKIIVVLDSDNYHRDVQLFLDSRTMGNLVENLKKLLGTENHDEAYKIANESNMIYSILKRTIFVDKYSKPLWVIKCSDFDILIPSLIVGSWGNRYSGDTEIISGISGMSYSKYMKEIQYLIDLDDPFLKDITEINRTEVANLEEAWNFLKSYIRIDSEYFNGFKEYAEYILTDRDPKWDLPQEKHYLAEILGKKSEFSTEIKKGVIKTMYYLMDMGYVDYVDDIVSSVLNEIDSSNKWFYIVDVIDDLIEVSPDLILSKMEEDIRSNFYISELFTKSTNERNWLVDRNYYTHVLWALEKALSWNLYAKRSIKILNSLAELDNTNYRGSNKPINSLCNGLEAWLHNINISIEEKVNLVEELYQNSNVGGKILSKILPSNFGATSFGVSKPQMRLEQQVQTLKWKKEQYDTYKSYIEIVLRNFEGDVRKLSILFEDIDLYSFDCESVTIDKMKKYLSTCDDDRAKQHVELIIRNIVNKSLKYQDADWAMSKSRIEKYKSLIEQIKYTNMFFEYLWLFDKKSPSILNPANEIERSDSWELDDLMIYEERSNAVQVLYNSKKSLIEFIELIPSDAHQQSALGEIISSKIYNYHFVEDFINAMILEERKDIIYGYSRQVFAYNGFRAVTDFVNENTNLTNEYWLTIISVVPLSEELIAYLDRVDDEKQQYYWKNSWIPYVDSENLNNMIFDRLVLFKSGYKAVELVNHRFKEATIEQHIVALSILVDNLKIENSGITYDSHIGYYIEQSLNKIYKSKVIDKKLRDKVISIEIAFTSSVRIGSKFLQEDLGSNPEIFAQLVSLAYISDIEEFNESRNSNHDRVASNAFSIIYNVKFFPYLNDKLDYNHLKRWVDKYVELIKETGHYEVGISKLGEVLSRVRKNSKQYFPDEVIRIIEEQSSRVLDNSIVSSIYNSRGVYSGTAGKGELELSEKFKRYYKEMKKAPHTKRILQDVSRGYKSQARREKVISDYRYR